jgi:hypothetical protein
MSQKENSTVKKSNKRKASDVTSAQVVTANLNRAAGERSLKSRKREFYQTSRASIEEQEDSGIKKAMVSKAPVPPRYFSNTGAIKKSLFTSTPLSHDVKRKKKLNGNASKASRLGAGSKLAVIAVRSVDPSSGTERSLGHPMKVSSSLISKPLQAADDSSSMIQSGGVRLEVRREARPLGNTTVPPIVVHSLFPSCPMSHVPSSSTASRVL